MALGECVELRSRVVRAHDQLGEAVCAVAAAKVGDLLEPALDLLEAAGLGLERVEEPAELHSHLAERQLGAAQSLPGGGKLGCDPLEWGHGPLGARDEVRPTFAVVGRDRRDGARSPRCELGQVAEALACGSELVLLAGLEPLGVGGERPELVEPRLEGGGVACQLVVCPACRGELAPGAAGGARRLGHAREGVEHRKLVGRPREPPLLELPAHRQQRFDDLRDVLPRGAPAPGIGTGPAVGEDPSGKDERVLALRPQLGELAEHVGVGKVELRLDVGLLGRRADQPRLAARPEQEADRVREDRLSRTGLAGDRIQPRVELELGLADEDQVLDTQAPEHPGIVRRPPDASDCRFQRCRLRTRPQAAPALWVGTHPSALEINL